MLPTGDLTLVLSGVGRLEHSLVVEYRRMRLVSGGKVPGGSGCGDICLSYNQRHTIKWHRRTTNGFSQILLVFLIFPFKPLDHMELQALPPILG